MSWGKLPKDAPDDAVDAIKVRRGVYRYVVHASCVRCGRALLVFRDRRRPRCDGCADRLARPWKYPEWWEGAPA